MKALLLSYGHIEYTIPLANALSDDSDMEVILMEPENKISPYRAIVSKRVKIEPFKQFRLRSIRNITAVLKMIKRIKTLNPDIVHIQRGNLWLNFFLLLLNKYPIIVTIHDIKKHPGDRASQLTFLINSIIIRKADHIIVHGMQLKRMMSRYYKKPDNRIHSIMRGDYFLFYNHKRTESSIDKNTGPKILFFGRIWEYKGLRFLIEAEPYISQIFPDMKIIIAGQGEDFNKYTQCMINPEQFIIMNYRIPDEIVLDLFENSDIVVLPYIEASQSGVIPLAYAVKKPVVITHVGSLPEVVEHGKTGYIVPPKDSKKLALAIIDLLKDPKKQKEFGENGYKIIKDTYSWENMARKTKLVYKKGIEEKYNYIKI